MLVIMLVCNVFSVKVRHASDPRRSSQRQFIVLVCHLIIREGEVHLKFHSPPRVDVNQHCSHLME